MPRVDAADFAQAIPFPDWQTILNLERIAKAQSGEVGQKPVGDWRMGLTICTAGRRLLKTAHAIRGPEDNSEIGKLQLKFDHYIYETGILHPWTNNCLTGLNGELWHGAKSHSEWKL